MIADIFLTCFVANLFAFVVFALLGWQIGAYLLKRAVHKHLPEILEKTLNGVPPLGERDPEAMANLQELFAAAHNTPPGVVPHLATVKCGAGCGREQAAPLELPLQPFLEGLGWRCEVQFDGWGCPICVRAALGPQAMTR
jgi:hypothetical protein